MALMKIILSRDLCAFLKKNANKLFCETSVANLGSSCSKTEDDRAIPFFYFSYRLYKTVCQMDFRSAQTSTDDLKNKIRNLVSDHFSHASLQFSPSNNFSTSMTEINKSGAKRDREEPEEKTKSKKIKHSPTHFLAVPIKNEKIRSRIVQIQDKLIAMYPELKQSLTSANKTHITLAVMHIPDEKLGRASEILENCCAVLKEKSLHGFSITYKSLSTFKEQVLFVDVVRDEQYDKLQQLACTVTNIFNNTDVPVIKENKEFNPHVTIAKISKMRNKKKKRNKINGSFAALYKNEEFGFEKVDTIQLLSMSKPIMKDGYYFIEKEVKFSDSHVSKVSCG